MGTLIPATHLLKAGEAIVIRSAVPDDAAGLLALSRAIVDEREFVITEPDEFDFTEEQEREWIRQHRDDPGRLLIVAESSGELIGSLFLESGPRRRLSHCGVVHMSVSRSWRSRGVGSALLASVIGWAQAHPGHRKALAGGAGDERSGDWPLSKARVRRRGTASTRDQVWNRPVRRQHSDVSLRLTLAPRRQGTSAQAGPLRLLSPPENSTCRS